MNLRNIRYSSSLRDCSGARKKGKRAFISGPVMGRSFKVHSVTRKYSNLRRVSLMKAASIIFCFFLSLSKKEDIRKIGNIVFRVAFALNKSVPLRNVGQCCVPLLAVFLLF
jgi:hypothetical protein